MDDTARLVEAFRERRTNDARKQLLEALVQELTPYEWRALQAKLNTRHFRYDIVGNLPVELVAAVFACLDTSTPYRLQCVSKRWLHVLCSPDVLKATLNEWDDTMNLEGGDYSLYRRKAQKVHRFRVGIPVDHRKCPWKSATFGHVLVEDTVVWLEPSMRTLNVGNLRTKACKQIRGDAREKINNVALSHQLVAFSTTLNTCYVWDLVGGDHDRPKQSDADGKRFRLAHGMFQQVTCRDRMVVCGGFVGNAAVIYMWDFDTQTGTSFEISLQDAPFAGRLSTCVLARDIALLPNPTSRTVAVFSSDRCERHGKSFSGEHAEADCSIYYSRFTFDGERVKDGTLPLSRLAGLHLGSFHPVDRRGRFALESKSSDPMKLHTERILFEFDENTDLFTELRCSLRETGLCVTAEISWWRDTFFQVLPFRNARNEDPGLVLLAHLGTSLTPTFKPQIYVGREQTKSWHNARLLVNDKFVVVFDSNDYQAPFHVLYFDEECKPSPQDRIVLEKNYTWFVSEEA